MPDHWWPSAGEWPELAMALAVLLTRVGAVVGLALVLMKWIFPMDCAYSWWLAWGLVAICLVVVPCVAAGIIYFMEA